MDKQERLRKELVEKIAEFRLECMWEFAKATEKKC